MENSQQNYRGKTREHNAERGRNQNGRGGNRGRGQPRDQNTRKPYQEKKPKVQEEIVVKQKIEMTANDWKSMFMGQAPSENYLNQTKQQDEMINQQIQKAKQTETESAKEPETDQVEATSKP